MDYDLAPHEDFDGFQQVRRFQGVSMSLILPASAFRGQTHDGAAHGRLLHPCTGCALLEQPHLSSQIGFIGFS